MELLIAAVVLIIVAAIAAPFVLGTIQDYRLRTAAWQVAGDLRLARQKAVASGKPYRFTFNKMSASTDPNSYIIERNDGGTWSRDPNPRIYLQSPGGPAFVLIDTSSTPSSGVITCNANGTVTPAGTVRLKDARNKRYEVAINTVGRVSVTKL